MAWEEVVVAVTMMLVGGTLLFGILRKTGPQDPLPEVVASIINELNEERKARIQTDERVGALMTKMLDVVAPPAAAADENEVTRPRWLEDVAEELVSGDPIGMMVGAPIPGNLDPEVARSVIDDMMRGSGVNLAGEDLKW